MTRLHTGGNMQKTISSATYSKFLDWLKQGRLDRGLTLQQLAALLEKHTSVVGKIETGARRLDVYEYCQYCEALQLNPTDGFMLLQRKVKKKKPA